MSGLPFAGKAPDIGALEFGKKDPAKAPDAFMAKCVKCGQEWEILPEEVLELFGQKRRINRFGLSQMQGKGLAFPDESLPALREILPFLANYGSEGLCGGGL